jgi:malate dehydrogenase (oxaloacetate-decarboxylating)(NADP+)
MTTNKRGIELLQDPSLNKSTAFTEAEKQTLGIVGLVPDVTETQDLQLSRVMMQLGHKSTDLDRYIYLVNLLDHDEVLFYRTVMSDPARFLPIVYDPTIGEACLKFGHIYRQARGMYLSMTRRGKVKEILRNWPQKDVRFICVTDGGRILGLGDLGANGAGIPIGKLQLYTACAGVPPQYLLPMYLDAGTNNEQYLHDPLYLGMRKTRPSTDELFSFVDEFVEAVQEVFPKCCIHFEDWTGTDAVHLLQRYRDKYCVYNDDVQGTAGITLAGMINAAKLKGTKLKDEKYLFLGAGSAGIGLAGLLCSALVGQGMTLKDAQSRVYMFDINGLLESTRKDLVDFQKPYAHQHAPTRDFVAAIESIKPTTIIGVSTIGGAFTRKVVESMSRINERPVVLALSNPDRARGMHGRAGIHLVKGQGDLRRRRPVSTGSLQRSDVFAGPGQQLLHLPGGGYGDLRNTGETCHRRDVHRSWAGGGGSGAVHFTEPRAPLSAPGEHFGDRDPNGSTSGKAGVRFAPCPRRAPD